MSHNTCSQCGVLVKSQGRRKCWRCASPGPCVECSRPSIARGLCGAHYSRMWKGSEARVTSPCGYCGKPVKHLSSSVSPYHRACKDKVPEWKRKGLPGPAEKRARRRIAKAAEGTKGGRVWISGTCSWCGEQYTGFGFFCSRSCRVGDRHSRNPYRFSIAPVDRRALYDRDNWVCQLCFEAVDPGLHYLDNWAASLDHIIPQSAMLIPDHSPSNLQLAHRWCNSMKGDSLEVLEVV